MQTLIEAAAPITEPAPGVLRVLASLRAAGKPLRWFSLGVFLMVVPSATAPLNAAPDMPPAPPNTSTAGTAPSIGVLVKVVPGTTPLVTINKDSEVWPLLTGSCGIELSQKDRGDGQATSQTITNVGEMPLGDTSDVVITAKVGAPFGLQVGKSARLRAKPQACS